MSEKSGSISSSKEGSRCATGDRDSTSPRSGRENELNGNKRTVSGQRYDSYRIAIYGNSTEKEKHKQQLRAKLKEQVQERDELHRKQLVDRITESDLAVALDRKSKQEDNESHQKKAAYLKQFSDENKKIMEEKEKHSRSTREAETEHERKLLDINPINWNMTLH